MFQNPSASRHSLLQPAENSHWQIRSQVFQGHFQESAFTGTDRTGTQDLGPVACLWKKIRCFWTPRMGWDLGSCGLPSALHSACLSPCTRWVTSPLFLVILCISLYVCQDTLLLLRSFRLALCVNDYIWIMCLTCWNLFLASLYLTLTNPQSSLVLEDGSHMRTSPSSS